MHVRYDSIKAMQDAVPFGISKRHSGVFDRSERRSFCGGRWNYNSWPTAVLCDDAPTQGDFPILCEFGVFYTVFVHSLVHPLFIAQFDLVATAKIPSTATRTTTRCSATEATT